MKRWIEAKQRGKITLAEEQASATVDQHQSRIQEE